MAVTELPASVDRRSGGLAGILAAQRRAFESQRAPSAEERRGDLTTLLRLVLDNRKAIVAACREDFGARSPHETEIAEVVATAHAIRYARRHVGAWMKARRRSTGIWFWPAPNRVVPQPKGVVGIMVPWNFPVNLALSPLAAALAAGNRAMIKTSELTPATGALLSRLVGERFTADHVSVTGGDVEVSREFAALAFDHLLFTGSTAVGRQVMRAAAENLTPVTLELGGKCPAIVDDGYPLQRAAERIVWGKLFNAGQICIAPDYVLVPDGTQKEFADLAGEAARRLYPKLAGNADYTSVISDGHYQRLCGYVAEAEAHGAHVEGALDAGEGRAERKLPLTIVVDPDEDLAVSTEEIFGPVLPIVGYRSLPEAIDYVNRRPRPLALYLFTEQAARRAEVLGRTTSGGVSVNDTLLHYLQDDLPFGGTGPSGMGSYHGREGFDTFSHHKAVFTQRGLGSRTGAQLLYPPYGPITGVLIRAMRRI